MPLLRRRRPLISFVVVVYDMAREAPRTLYSLSRAHQRGASGIDYDVLAVDNGSPEPFQLPADLQGSFRLHRLDPAPPSPARAVNAGVAMTDGENVGLILDGARMVTPGVVALGAQALALHPRPIVTTMAWHLGPEHQSRSVLKGYDQATEDRMLDACGWRHDGYALFDVASLAMANPESFFGPVNESCCLIVPRTLWDEVGGVDERFDLPGGGLVNLDLFTRLVGRPGTQLVVLVGEGSFHQVHGGISMRPDADHAAWGRQYQELRGRAYERPPVDPLFLGRLAPQARRWRLPPPAG